MLDENLPNFFLKPNLDGLKHHQAFYFSQRGSQPEPTYDVHRLDPASPQAKSTYAVALFDSHNPDVLFGEVLMRPSWSLPTLSQEEIRKNGGIAPPPQPQLPTSFTIQLYEPDQQVEVTQKSSTWSNSNWYEFSMPEKSFREPSTSALDRSRSDPAADATTPKMNFVWRRESKLSKDLTCFLTGKSTDQTSKKKKNKEPDIAVALFSGLNDLTIYETNLYRVEMEDHKGLEVVILLSASVIKDVFFGSIKEAFHLDDYGRKNSGGKVSRKNSSPLPSQGPFIAPTGPTPPPITQSPLQAHPSAYQMQSSQRPVQPHASKNDRKRQSLPPLQTNSPRPHAQPAAGQWSQYASDEQKARMAAQAGKQKVAEDPGRRERQKADEAEAKRIKKQMEAEEKERRRKQAEVDKETERLRRKYGTQGQTLPPQPPRPQQRPYAQPQPQPRPAPQTRPHRQPNGLQPIPQGRVAHAPPPRPAPSGGWHVQQARPPPQAAYFGGNGRIKPSSGQTLKTPKRSFFGLRTSNDDANAGKISKKKSSLF